MLDSIKNATKISQEAWKEHKAPVQVKALINQLTLDVQKQIDAGEWDFAVKVSYYRHEIAKLYNSTDWYEAFLEIRKARDWIALAVSPNDGTKKDDRA